MFSTSSTFFAKRPVKLFIGLLCLGTAFFSLTYAATKSTINPTESEENINAATLLYQKNITKTLPTHTSFYEGLTRKNAALLVKRFATNVLGKKDMKTTSECNYTDIGEFATADQADIVSSCTLGIFKSTSTFNPHYAFSRGQLVIVVARLISGNPNMELTEAYDYLLHLGIVKVDDRNESTKQALRKDLYIMLARITVGISQTAAFGQFSTMPIGNIHTQGGETFINTDSNQTKVFKVIAYQKDPIYNNYTALQLGSAVLIQPTKIITNAHVILTEEGKLADGFEVCRTIAGSTKPTCFTTATVDYYDEDRDLAILTITNRSGLPTPVTIASFAPTNGEEISVLGYPGIGGNSITLTKGIISGIEREKYKSDVKIDRGNSGGGSFNRRGELIGIPNSAMVDTDSMSYIIPYTVIQEFLKKEGHIVTVPTTKIDTDFSTYIKTLEAQTNANGINTPLFSLPSIGSFSFDSFNFDASHNLYNVLLSSADTSTSMNLQTQVGNDNANIENSGPSVYTGKDDFNLEDYCNNLQTGDKVFGNATWGYFRCDNVGENGGKRHAITGISSGVYITATIEHESASTIQADAAEKILNGINIKNNAQIHSFDIYTVGPINLPKMNNLDITYKMDEDGMITFSAYLNNTSSDISISSTFAEIVSSVAKSMKNKSIKEFAGYMDDFLTRFYNITLTGTTIKNSNNNIFYIVGYKDKAESTIAGIQPTRYIKATTIVFYNNKYIKIGVQLSYDGPQNTILDKQIIDFIDQIKIEGTYPLNDNISGLPAISSLSFNP